jgi:hypothetical protein
MRNQMSHTGTFLTLSVVAKMLCAIGFSKRKNGLTSDIGTCGHVKLLFQSNRDWNRANAWHQN